MDFLKYLEGMRNDILTKIFEIFTLFGEELVILAILCILYWCYSKRLAYRICFSYFVSGLTIQALKITFRIPRPWILDSEFKPVPSAIATATGYSFPSGHTQSATALFGTFFMYAKKTWKKIVCLIIIIGVGLSRMYLGVHTPKDVIVSFLVSGLLVVFAQLVLTEQLLERRRGLISICMGLAAIIVMVYAILLMSREVIEMKYASDCCKAAGAGIGFSIGWYIEAKYIQFQERTCSLRGQIIKCFIGIIGTLAIKSGLKFVIGESIPADIIRYTLTVLWVTAIFPMIIKALFSKHEPSQI